MIPRPFLPINSFTHSPINNTFPFILHLLYELCASVAKAAGMLGRNQCFGGNLANMPASGQAHGDLEIRS